MLLWLLLAGTELSPENLLNLLFFTAKKPTTCFESQSPWLGEETRDAPETGSGCAGRSLVFKSSTGHSSTTALDCLFVLRPLLVPLSELCYSLCWAAAGL